MKAFIVLIAVLVGNSAFASKVDWAEQSRFNSMTAVEAAAYPWFEKYAQNVQMPGTSSWLNGTELCIGNGTLRSVRPLTDCVLWSASKNGKVRTFPSRNWADDYGSNVQCARTVTRVLESPLVYTAKVCTLWGVQTRIGAAKTFTSKLAADRFANYDRDARGDVYCAGTSRVTKNAPTTFLVEFYTDGNLRVKDQLLGTHRFAIDACR